MAIPFLDNTTIIGTDNNSNALTVSGNISSDGNISATTINAGDATFNTVNTETFDVGPFTQIGNFYAPANTLEGNNTFFRIGTENVDNKAAQIGYRAGGDGFGRNGFICLDFYGADYLFQLSHDSGKPELWTGETPTKLLTLGDGWGTGEIVSELPIGFGGDLSATNTATTRTNLGLDTASQMPSSSFAPSNLYQNLSGNWNASHTFIQSNSAELISPINFTLNTTAPNSYIQFVQEPLILRKLNNFDLSIPAFNNEGTINVPITGNAYDGQIIWTIGISLLENQLSGLEPTQFHVEYNNLYNLYSSNTLFGTRSILFTNLSYNLTAIRFPQLKTSGGIGISNCSRVTEINFNELEYVHTNSGLGVAIGLVGGYGSAGMPLVKQISFPKLRYVEGVVTVGGYSNTAPLSLTAVDLQNLEYCTSTVLIGNDTAVGIHRYYFELLPQNINISKLSDCGGITFGFLPNLQVLGFPSLKKLRGDARVIECSAVTQINFPELEYCIAGYLVNLGQSTTTISLTSMSFPKLKYWAPNVSSITWSTNAQLCSVTFGDNVLQFFGRSFLDASPSLTINQRLLQSSVDNILKAFARLDGTNGTTAWTGSLSLAGNNAPPSYTGGVTTTSAGTNFVRTGNTVVASVVGHGHTNGDIVTFTDNGQGALNGTYIVTVNTPDQFQYTTPTSGNLTGSGAAKMRRTTVATDGFRYLQTIVLRGGSVTANIINL